MQTPDFIQQLDSNDPLANKRDAFLLPSDSIYMDGNSLGPSTKSARDVLLKTTQNDWQNDLIQSWNTHDWIDLPTSVGEKIAPIIGAKKTR